MCTVVENLTLTYEFLKVPFCSTRVNSGLVQGVGWVARVGFRARVLGYSLFE